MQFEKISWQIIMIVFAGLFFLWNLTMPFASDDISYAFIWDGEHSGNLVDGIGKRERIASFTDIFISQWSHYFHWGGRVIAHSIVQFFSWIGKSYFNIINVIVFCALTFLIFKIGTGLSLRDMNKNFLLFILFALYFFTLYLFSSMIWMTGAINYMWMVTLELVFILPFALKYRDKNFNPPKIFVPIMTFVGLLAGWSGEPGAVATSIVIFCCLVKFWLERNLPKWMLAGSIFFLIGFLLLILAPGDMERLAITSQIRFPNSDMNYSEMYYTFDAIAFRFKDAFIPIIFRESILFLPIIFYFLHERRNIIATNFILTFLSASIILMFVMVGLPEFGERTGFPATIFLLVASVAALKEILPALEKIYMRHKKILSTAAKILFIG